MQKWSKGICEWSHHIHITSDFYKFLVGVWLYWSHLFNFCVINRNAFCWQRHLFLSLYCSIISVLVVTELFKILSCVKKRRKKNPANCSYFICKASNDKYFKWLSIYCFSLVAHQSFDRFSYLWNKLDHFLLLTMEVYFYSYFIVFFFLPLVW